MNVMNFCFCGVVGFVYVNIDMPQEAGHHLFHLSASTSVAKLAVSYLIRYLCYICVYVVGIDL